MGFQVAFACVALALSCSNGRSTEDAASAAMDIEASDAGAARSTAGASTADATGTDPIGSDGGISSPVAGGSGGRSGAVNSTAIGSGSLGGASIGGAKSTQGGSVGTTDPVSTAARLDELKIDPQGADGNNEFIELAGEPNAKLSGYFLVEVESDFESNLGQVDKVIDLSGTTGNACRFVVNGRVLLMAAAGAVIPKESATTVCIASGLSGGGLENGTAFLGLFSGSPLPKVGDDWDIADSGVLTIPASATLHDAITWTDGDAGDALYASTRLGPKPRAHAAWRCIPAQLGEEPWRFGQLLGDSSSFEVDLANTTPSKLPDAVLTPGGANSCAAPTVGTLMGSGGTAAAGNVGGEAGSTFTSSNSAGGSGNLIGSLVSGTASGGATDEDPCGASCGGRTNISAKETGTGGSGLNGNGGATAAGRAAVVGGSTSSSGASTSILVIEAAAPSGGTSGWWSPDPFLGTSGVANGSDPRESGASGSGGDGIASGAPPNVPGGCSVFVTRGTAERNRHIPTFVLFSVTLCWWRRAVRRKNATSGLASFN